MKKIIFFDTETTGLDPKINGMHQLAGEVVINNKVVEKFNYKINPFKGCITEKKALEVSNTSLLDFFKYNEEFQVHYQFTTMLEKYIDPEDKRDRCFLAGWRAPEFDVRFLQSFLKRNNVQGAYQKYFWTNTIDIKTLATQHLLDKRRVIDSFSLAPVAQHLGVEVDVSLLHTAAYDAFLCRKVYEVVTDTKITNRVLKKRLKR